MNVLEQIQDAFPDHGVPRRDALVVFDGFDQPAKEYALDVFGGKTRDQVRALVGKGATGFEGLWGIEDLQVLEPAALQYYLEPFLRFLIVFEYSKPDEFSFFLCYHLSEVIRIRGADTFTPAQRHVLAKIANHLAGRVAGDDDWSTHLRGHCVSLKERTDVPDE